MLDVNSAQLYHWLGVFIWPFFRIAGYAMVAPLLGQAAIPVKAKIAFSVLLSVIVGPLLPDLPKVTIMSLAGLGLIVEQLIIGIAMGLCMKMAFSTVQAAGEYIGMQMGIGFATQYSADTGANSVIISRLLDVLAVLMFLAIDGHLFMLQILVDTFTQLPIGRFEFNPEAWKMIAVYAKTIFSSGFLLALPLVTALLLMNLAMGILNRSAPQLTIFSVGFPLTLMVGLVLLMVMMKNLGPFMDHLFFDSMKFVQKLIESMHA
ncbi:flagellar biosynthetic protein FliR [Pseudomonas putida]|uniref:Flagellar biosynthetic protein FliR n=1 Tax=Pseudomonas putida TaxID=303 RepID=A0A8I1EA00_PSEPU|nr:flagellar biosynthetic protein FliR [Pseudomonas putida]